MWPTFPGYRTAPAQFSIAKEVLDDPIELRGVGKEPAIRHAGGDITFEELRRRVDSLARGLQASGVAVGERVLLRGFNTPEWATAFIALLKLGALPVLATTLLGPKELESILTTSCVGRAIVDAEGADTVREAWSLAGESGSLIVIGQPGRGDTAIEQLMSDERPLGSLVGSRDSPAFVVYTSGSTGRPKGIVHAHRWVAAVGDMARLRGEDFRPGEVSLGVGELSNVGALGHCLLFPLRGGACASLLRGRALPDRMVECIQSFRPTIFFGVASAFRRLLALPGLHASSMTSIKLSISGGEATGPSLPVEWERRFGTPLYEHYALSEFQMVLANGPGVAVRPGSVGVAPPGLKVAVLNESLQEVTPDDIGHLAIHESDPGLFLTYDNQPELWRRCMRGGWFITGDMFRRDADGYFWVAGRADDMFKSRGYAIAPREIEDVLGEHPAVQEVAVVGVADEKNSKAIKAVLVLRDGWEASNELTEELRERVRSRLAPYKVPSLIDYRLELPRVGAIAKVNRRLLEGKSTA